MILKKGGGNGGRAPPGPPGSACGSGMYGVVLVLDYHEMSVELEPIQGKLFLHLAALTCGKVIGLTPLPTEVIGASTRVAIADIVAGSSIQTRVAAARIGSWTKRMQVAISQSENLFPESCCKVQVQRLKTNDLVPQPKNLGPRGRTSFKKINL